MLFRHDYPYTNFHEMNLDWLLMKIRQLEHDYYDFSAINAIEYGGDWAADTSYKKNTVVVYNGTGYLSLTAVPAGIPVTNTEYWVSIGAVTPESLGLVEEVADIKADLEDMADAIDDINDKIADGFLHTNATYHVSIYVDGDAGTDSNDGFSSASAVRTMKKALDIMNETSSGVYIHIISPGSYTIPYPVISGAMVHFLFDASNITLYWLPTTDDGWSKCFYSCYINMHGNSDGTSVFYIRGSRPAYLEGGKLTISNITLDSDSAGAFGIIGGSIQSSGNIYKTHLYMGLANGLFSDDSFEDKSTYHTSVIHVYNSSDITFRGGVKFKDIDNNATVVNLISATASTIRVLQDIILENTTLASKYIYGASTQFLGGANRLITWLATCYLDRSMVNGDYFSSTTVYPT